MKTSVETVYSCDHCGRKMFRKCSASLHERVCKKNPNNMHLCIRGCVHLEKERDMYEGGVIFTCKIHPELGDMKTYKKDRSIAFASLTRMPLECKEYQELI